MRVKHVFFYVKKDNFNVAEQFWAKTARIPMLDPIFDKFEGPEKTPEIYKLLITHRFLQ